VISSQLYIYIERTDFVVFHRSSPDAFDNTDASTFVAAFAYEF